MHILQQIKTSQEPTLVSYWLVRAYMARQGGLEPSTHGLEGRCSIQLSYWRIVDRIGITRNDQYVDAGILWHMMPEFFQ